MKNKSKYDFMLINKRMNNNFNAKGDFISPKGNKNIEKGEELKLLNRLTHTTKCTSR